MTPPDGEPVFRLGGGSSSTGEFALGADPSGGSRLLAGDFTGLVDREQVRSIRIVDAPVFQDFEAVGSYFVLSYVVDGIVEGLTDSSFELEVEFVDGTTERSRWAGFPAPIGEPCSRVESCIRVLGLLADNALEAGYGDQAAALADGVLTQPEYAEAFNRFSSCIEELGLATTTEPFLVVADGSDEAARVLSCHEVELSLLEEAATLQNNALSIDRFAE